MYLIPVQAAYLPVKGLQQLIKTIGRVKKQLNPKLKVEGILLTIVDNRKNYTHIKECDVITELSEEKWYIKTIKNKEDYSMSTINILSLIHI